VKLFDFGMTLFVIVVAGILFQGGFAIGKQHPDANNVIDGLVS
jgi:hypothetical protein